MIDGSNIGEREQAFEVALAETIGRAPWLGLDARSVLPPRLASECRRFIFSGRGRARPRLLLSMHDALAADVKGDGDGHVLSATMASASINEKSLRDNLASAASTRSASTSHESTQCQSAMQAAVGVELLHIFTLIHDDIVDESPMRAGAPTLAAVAQTIAGNRRDGDAMAMIAGDLLYTLALETLATLPGPPQLASAALQAALAAARSTAVAQIEELAVSAGATRPGPARAVRIAAAKTAPIGFCLPLALAGMIAGVSPAMRAALHGAGMALGAAYQLVDDLADLDAAACGARRWEDAVMGRWTLLATIAERELDARSRRTFLEFYGRRDLDRESERMLANLIERAGARERIADRVVALLARARGAVFDARLGARAQAVIDAVARQISARARLGSSSGACTRSTSA